MSPRTISRRSPAVAANGRFSARPVEKLSRTRIRARGLDGQSVNSTRCEPMKPAPPVTTKNGCHSHDCNIGSPLARLRDLSGPGSRCPGRGRPGGTPPGAGKNVEHDRPLVGRAPPVRHVRRRLPEVPRLEVVLHAVLDADPLPLQTYAPLLVGGPAKCRTISRCRTLSRYCTRTFTSLSLITRASLGSSAAHKAGEVNLP